MDDETREIIKQYLTNTLTIVRAEEIEHLRALTDTNDVNTTEHIQAAIKARGSIEALQDVQRLITSI